MQLQFSNIGFFKPLLADFGCLPVRSTRSILPNTSSKHLLPVYSPCHEYPPRPPRKPPFSLPSWSSPSFFSPWCVPVILVRFPINFCSICFPIFVALSFPFPEIANSPFSDLATLLFLSLISPSPSSDLFVELYTLLSFFFQPFSNGFSSFPLLPSYPSSFAVSLLFFQNVPMF